MRVLFTLFPALAHVHPIVPLAWSLQNAGHEVRVAIHPDATDLVTDTGLTAVPIGRGGFLKRVVQYSADYQRLERLTGDAALDTGAGRQRDAQWPEVLKLLSVYKPVLPDLVDFARGWRPDLVLWDSFCAPAPIAAHLSGAAHARFLWGQDNVAWLRERSLEQLGEEPGEDPVTAFMRPMLKPYGLEYREEFLLGQWTIDPTPAALRPPVGVQHMPLRRVPYNGAATVPDWLREPPSRPRVCLTLGVGGRGRQLFGKGGASFGELLRAVAALDIELVATINAADLAEAGDIPENVRVLEYVPLNLLLPTCSAVIHHGGGGTFAAAAAHRVPQLITPMPLWGEAGTARYVEERGAGVVLDPARFTVDALVDHLTKLLEDPSYRDGAAGLYEEIQAMPGPNDIVPELEKLVALHRR